MKGFMRSEGRHNKGLCGAAMTRTTVTRTLCAAALAACCSLSSPAWAQKNASGVGLSTKIEPPSAGLTLNMPIRSDLDVVGLSPTLSGALIDIPIESVGSGLFDLDIRNTDCFAGLTSCFSRDELGLTEGLDAEYTESTFFSLNDSGLDLELTPRASLHFDDESSSALVGAFVRIGDDLRKKSDFTSNTWYFFAGADAEALTYRPDNPTSLTRGRFNLQDRIIVGDAQAGVGYRIGDADLALTYFRREVSGFSNNDALDQATSYDEEAAAISFTWRR